jgi:lipopolysaccharide export LptBFGC system permease protein LptF
LAAKNIPLDGYTLYFDTYDRKTDELLKVRVEAWNQKSLTVLFAERAVFTDEGLLLYNYQTDLIDFQALNTDYAEAEGLLADLIKRHSSASSPEQSILLTTSDSYEDLITRFSEGGFEDSRSIREAYADANDASLSERDRKQSAVLFHRKLAEPLANLSLLLIAVPLSLLYAGSRSVAFGLSLVVTLAWYLLFTLGQLFAQAGTVPVWLGVWAANILLAAVGVYLLMVPSRLR